MVHDGRHDPGPRRPAGAGGAAEGTAAAEATDPTATARPPDPPPTPRRPDAAPAPPPPAASPPVRPGDVRVSDGERQAVVDRLSRAAGEGLLSLAELDDASGRAYAAVTRDDLDRVVRAFPLPDRVAGPVAGRGPAAQADGAGDSDAGGQGRSRRRWIVSVMGDEKRRGRWRIARRTGAFALMGDVDLDLRGALLDHHVVEITAWTIMGDVVVTVPEGVPVESSGLVLLGDRTDRIEDVPVPPDAPTVRVRSFGLMGDVTVRSKPSRSPDDTSHR